jgi:hypothetical protein
LIEDRRVLAAPEPDSPLTRRPFGLILDQLVCAN